MIFCDEKYPAILDEICDFLTPADVELVLVDSTAMQEINKEQRGIDKTTDVLSFPLNAVLHCPVGTIVINKDATSSVADLLGHSYDEEMALLFTHGLLHVLGYDHEKDSGEMRDMEFSVIQKFDLPSSLIIRNEEQ